MFAWINRQQIMGLAMLFACGAMVCWPARAQLRQYDSSARLALHITSFGMAGAGYYCCTRPVIPAMPPRVSSSRVASGSTSDIRFWRIRRTTWMVDRDPDTSVPPARHNIG
jgi:hypothetical protein